MKDNVKYTQAKEIKNEAPSGAPSPEKEKIDAKKMIIYSELMRPKFKEGWN